MDITTLIPKGRQNRITRKELATISNQSDRRNRKQIEEAILRGEPIASSSKGKGYFYTDDSSDLRASAMDIEAKAYSLLKRAKALSKTADKMDSKQVTIERIRNGRI